MSWDEMNQGKRGPVVNDQTFRLMVEYLHTLTFDISNELQRGGEGGKGGRKFDSRCLATLLRTDITAANLL